MRKRLGRWSAFDTPSCIRSWKYGFLIAGSPHPVDPLHEEGAHYGRAHHLHTVAIVIARSVNPEYSDRQAPRRTQLSGRIGFGNSPQ
jgi:hypothetical protein